ncbi:helicase RepA family protein [Caballeronia sp. INML1]|uniref:helicase RepA family protein n=1 Tax=Caballeronia sp. INML1 TaxID=2921760 RepID=UPI0020297A17|nr:helicase RepA family protein [Caballeronia sp. INML1]
MSAKTNVKEQAARTTKPELAPVTKAVRRSLNVVSAADLPTTYAAPDELVQGLLTTGGSSMLYGDSHCGKTFFAIDLAASIARGCDWMGRRVEQGLVLYLAAESPESVRCRLQAYQKHHGVRVPNFFIAQKAINLFADNVDTEAIIAEVQALEAEHGQPVRLIVGDTLARLSAGANENMGQDMGRVIARIDEIRSACSKAHFMLIHHSGRNAAAGARGWTGMRAAVDTEIEVTEQASWRCAKVTKNRDLGSKGELIGFTLEVVEAGTTKWGAAATSCVVVPADVSERPSSSKRGSGPKPGTIKDRVMAFLREQKVGVQKADVVAHVIKCGGAESSVYRDLKGLVAAGHLREVDDVLSVTDSAT